MPVDNLIPNMQFTPIYQRYIGNALQEEKALMDRVETKAASVDAYYDQIDAQTKAAQSADFKNDTEALKLAKQKAADEIRKAHARGDYENLGKQAKLAASEFMKIYTPVAQNNKALQESITKEMDAENGYSPEEKARWIKQQKIDYEKNGGLQIDPVTGNASNFYTGSKLNKRIDFGEKTLKMTGDIKPTDITYGKDGFIEGVNVNGTVLALRDENGDKIPATYLRTHNEITGVLKNRIQQVIGNYLENSPEFKYQTKVEGIIDAVGITDEQFNKWKTEKLPVKTLEVLKDNLKDDGNFNPTDKDLYLEHYRLQKKLGLLNSAYGMAHTVTKFGEHIFTSAVEASALSRKQEKLEKEAQTLAIPHGLDIEEQIDNMIENENILKSHNDILGKATKEIKTIDGNINTLLKSVYTTPTNSVLSGVEKSNLEKDIQTLKTQGKDITLDNLKGLKSHLNIWNNFKPEDFAAYTKMLSQKANYQTIAQQSQNVVDNGNGLTSFIDKSKFAQNTEEIYKNLIGIVDIGTPFEDVKRKMLRNVGILGKTGHNIDLSKLTLENYIKAMHQAGVYFEPEGYKNMDAYHLAKYKEGYHNFFRNLSKQGIIKTDENTTHAYVNETANSNIKQFSENALTGINTGNIHYNVGTKPLGDYIRDIGAKEDGSGNRVKIDLEDQSKIKYTNVLPTDNLNKVALNFEYDGKKYSVDVDSGNSKPQIMKIAKDIINNNDYNVKDSEGQAQEINKENWAKGIARDIGAFKGFNSAIKKTWSYTSNNNIKYEVYPVNNKGQKTNDDDATTWYISIAAPNGKVIEKNLTGTTIYGNTSGDNIKEAALKYVGTTEVQFQQ